MLDREFRQFEPLAGDVAHLHDERPPGGAPIDLHIALPLGAQHQVERFAVFGERLHSGNQFHA